MGTSKEKTTGGVKITCERVVLFERTDVTWTLTWETGLDDDSTRAGGSVTIAAHKICNMTKKEFDELSFIEQRKLYMKALSAMISATKKKLLDDKKDSDGDLPF